MNECVDSTEAEGMDGLGREEEKSAGTTSFAPSVL